ncbi:hypothetical protein GCM10023175_28840 [Pseudonocardia xishanensis]|uniref:Uncharacterized protein n=2 Tax=Pseudonocardia xishanensis TaxID=630995 RepID=A0ABP8RRP8_9PSEU
MSAFMAPQQTAAFPQMGVRGDTLAETVSFINDFGVGVIGTPEQARDQVARLVEQSGGFGTLLLMGHDWATPERTRRSDELVAEEVAAHFQSQATATVETAALAGKVREGHNGGKLAAIAHMTEKYQAEVTAKG